jgi:hypothetical protein
MDALPRLTIDLDGLGFDRGAHLLVAHGLGQVAAGERVRVVGTDPHLRLHLNAWCRSEGHDLDGDLVRKGTAAADRWRDAVRAGEARRPSPSADPAWGLAARGALVEDHGPALTSADLVDRDAVWADIAPKLYAQAAAGQWDPDAAIDWTAGEQLPDEVEDAVVQVMTYLIENEQAALTVPAAHLTRIHPHFREVIAFLATQVADEARHVEVFTRRALLHREVLGTSSVGGRASLQTLLEEPDFTLASLMLSVLGEGTFLDLLTFLERHAPDAVTRRVAQLVRTDEARHVAFGQAHLEYRAALEPNLRPRVRLAIERRHDVLRRSAGLNADVRDALALLAAGAFTTGAVAAGWQRVQELERAMHDGRRRRLGRLGFSHDEAGRLSALHTSNFM